MGFYYGGRLFRKATVGLDPVLTPHEYTSAFERAMRVVLGGEAPADPSPATLNGVPPPSSGVMVHALTRRVRRCPTDPTAHRHLGAALLHGGSRGAGVRHLGIALRLLLADAGARESLHGSLRVRLEIGLVLVPLIPIAAGSGRPALLRRVISLLP